MACHRRTTKERAVCNVSLELDKLSVVRVLTFLPSPISLYVELHFLSAQVATPGRRRGVFLAKRSEA
ncbi:hypothetical protein J6590_021647 [Homalodisca vitripennis]|nr:hypothetical protein J6590_021647 [Homalodisca vitripennis]